MDGAKLYVHRVIWEMHNGPIPEGMMVDHIDGDGLNNRLNNLRLVTMTGNGRNARRPSTNSSGLSGVIWVARARKWRAYTRDNDGKQKHVGYFDDAATAKQALNAERSRLGYHLNHGRA